MAGLERLLARCPHPDAAAISRVRSFAAFAERRRWVGPNHGKFLFTRTPARAEPKVLRGAARRPPRRFARYASLTAGAGAWRRRCAKRTAASGVAWSGCASLRGPLCAGEALLEARTQASVALFKLGAHSATLRPEFGGPKSLRCCCAKGVGHRAQLMLRARRGARENDYPVPLLRTPTPQSSLSPVLTHSRGVTTTESLELPTEMIWCGSPLSSQPSRWK